MIEHVEGFQLFQCLAHGPCTFSNKLHAVFWWLGWSLGKRDYLVWTVRSVPCWTFPKHCWSWGLWGPLSISWLLWSLWFWNKKKKKKNNNLVDVPIGWFVSFHPSILKILDECKLFGVSTEFLIVNDHELRDSNFWKCY